jgi:hypothetical protein
MKPSSIDNETYVRGVEIRDQTVNFMPKFTCLLAQRLKALRIWSCHLKVISKDDLQQFPRLLQLFLQFDDIEWLEGDLFNYNPLLEIVGILGNNNLLFIEANLLDSLKKIRHAYFAPGCVGVNAESAADLKELMKKLKTSCKDEWTELKMLAHRNMIESESTPGIQQLTIAMTTTTNNTNSLTTQSPSNDLSCFSEDQSESNSERRLTPTMTTPAINFASQLVPVLSRAFVFLSFVIILQL